MTDIFFHICAQIYCQPLMKLLFGEWSGILRLRTAARAGTAGMFAPVLNRAVCIFRNGYGMHTCMLATVLITVKAAATSVFPGITEAQQLPGVNDH